MTTRGRYAISPLGAGAWLAALLSYGLTLLTGDGWLLAVTAAAFVLPLVDLGFGCRAGTVRLVRPDRAVSGARTVVRVERVGTPAVAGDLVATLAVPGGPVVGRLPVGCDATSVSHDTGPRGPMPPLAYIADAYGPLGLAARRRHLLDTTPVLVHPAPAEPLPVPAGGDTDVGGGTAGRLGPGLTPAGLRDHRPGDPQRHVAWRATARQGVPVMREWALDADAGLVVVTGTFGPADEPAVARAAATAVAAIRDGRQVTVLSADATGRPVTPGEALDLFARLVSAPAPAHGTPGPVLWLAAEPAPAGAIRP
ncbi:MAG: DUF58 domain-containing protein [Mycobacteriales bacterium]